MSSRPSEWGAHFCLLHPLAPVGAVAVRGLLGGLAGTQGHHPGLLGFELERREAGALEEVGAVTEGLVREREVRRAGPPDVLGRSGTGRAQWLGLRLPRDTSLPLICNVRTVRVELLYPKGRIIIYYLHTASVQEVCHYSISLKGTRRDFPR